ncbi:MAG: DUF3617 family protein [Sphingomonadaceae bacterium]|nr:DUF3617 family protein [Sphingomonadaceae bacterium]
MRALALLAVLPLAASCGDDPVENKAAAVVAAPSPGQWELTSQVTRFTQADHGRPKIDTPVGTRATQSVCVAAGQQLPAALFAGDNLTCSYSAYYVRNGIANATLNCRREGLNGDIAMNSSGHFQADSIDLHRSIRTILQGDGDVLIESDVTGRRTGATCTPAPAGPAGQNKQ